MAAERNQVAALVDSQGLQAGRLMRTLVMQEVGGTRATIAAGVEAIEAMLPLANAYSRSSVPASYIKVGLECGGSDGFPASPPIRRSALQWTCWCAMAVPPSCRKHRKSTAWKTC